jgi:hypothetical protein
MDQGIIQATKLKFRKRQISQMDKGVSKTGSQILKDISILDAIFWISRSWDEIEITTIEKCFAKAGFKVDSDMILTDDEGNINESDNDDDDDDIPLRIVQMSRDLFGCEFKELYKIDAAKK